MCVMCRANYTADSVRSSVVVNYIWAARSSARSNYTGNSLAEKYV